MTVRDAKQIPPFILDEKRAIVKSLDQRGREHLAFGDALDIWINFALAPLAGGLTDSIDMRFVGGAYWYRVKLTPAKALQLLRREEGTEDLVAVIDTRYSVEATPLRRSRLRCQYATFSRRCDKEALDGWTTCKGHEEHGGPREAPETVEEAPDEPIEIDAPLLPTDHLGRLRAGVQSNET